MPRRRSHTRNDMKTDETEETTPVPTLRRSKRLAPYYVDVEAKHSGEKSIGSQRLVSGYTFSSDDFDSDSDSDSDDYWIPAQKARSHDSSVQPDDRVRGPGKQRRRKRARRSKERDNSKNSAKRSNQRQQSQSTRESEYPHTLPTQPISFRRRQRKRSHPNRAALP